MTALRLARLFLPALVVGGREFAGAGIGRVGDRGQQHDQLARAAAFPVGHVVFDDPDQVRVIGVDVLPCAGGLDDCCPAGPADAGADQDAQVGAVVQDGDHRQLELGRGPPQQGGPGPGGPLPRVPGVEVPVGGQ